MKPPPYMKLLSLPIMLATLQTWAHDPNEHKQDTQEPDCAAMKNMDHSKMDMNDPVMQAMMMKCMHHMHSVHESEKPDETSRELEHQHEKDPGETP